LRDFKSLCVGAISETVQDSYNSGPFKNRMSSSSGGHFHQSCHVTKSCVILDWHQRQQTCRVLRREGWRSACCRRRRRMFAMKVCCSATSFYWGSATSDDAFACLVKSSALDPLPTFIQLELVDVTATVRDTSSSRSCWWHLTA